MLGDVQWISSKTGERVPVVQNITLCSKYNPIKEAKDWLEGYLNTIPYYRYLFVLGVGGGFHIKVLASQFPNKHILVLDSMSGLVSEISKSMQDLKNVRFITQNFLHSQQVLEALRSSSYRVLRYEPSCRLSEQLYAELEQTLLGRTDEGLKKIIEIKSQKDPYYKSIDILGLKGNESIKDIVPLIRQKKIKLQEDNIWYLLRELVS